MEEKTAKEIVKQLTRIADALEKSNNLEVVREKRMVTLNKLEEKNLRTNLRDQITNISENTDFRDHPIAEK